VVITGQNLQNATQIYFDGVPAVLTMLYLPPAVLLCKYLTYSFSKIDTTKLYTLKYKQKEAQQRFLLNWARLHLLFAAISNIFADPGDSVYVYGANLFLVQRFSYRGTAIPSFKLDTNGTSIGFLCRLRTTNDQVSVTTKSGG
jgi:hypothetical protein